jgi:hypothetical protein
MVSTLLRLSTTHSVHPLIHSIPHPSATYLAHLATTGVPAVIPTQWTSAQLYHAYNRGPHPSVATTYATFLVEDMFDYTNMGFWTVLPFDAVKHYKQLKLAPAGVVPQRDRGPRPIMDYSFFQTNQTCLPLAPTHAMQFGYTLQRILQRLVYCNAHHGPPLMAKIDLADGYYCVPLAVDAALHLAVIIPTDVPPMGWGHSPPSFVPLQRQSRTWQTHKLPGINPHTHSYNSFWNLRQLYKCERRGMEHLDHILCAVTYRPLPHYHQRPHTIITNLCKPL